MLNAGSLPRPQPQGDRKERWVTQLLQGAFQQLFHEKVKCQKACMLHICVSMCLHSR